MCGYSEIDISLDSIEALNIFVSVFNSEMMESFNYDGYRLDVNDFKVAKNTYHAFIWGDPLFTCTMLAVDEVLDVIRKFIVDLPTVKLSIKHYYDDSGEEGYTVCKYSNNILTIMRKDPNKKKEVKSYELDGSTWRITGK